MPSMTFLGSAEDAPRTAEAEQAGWTVFTVPGPLTPADQADAWRRLSRFPGHAVWVDWSGLEPPDLVSLRRFRVTCPDTRILIEVPEALEPPDATLAQAVAMGIFDIVRSPTTPLAQALTHPVGFAAAAVWQGEAATFDDAPSDPPPVVKEIVTVERETVVERRVPMTTRPVLVAVWGAVPGTGATTLSLAVGRLLAGYGPTAVLDHAPTVRQGAWVADGATGLATVSAAQQLPEALTVRVTTWDGNPQRDGHAIQVPSWRTAVQARTFSYVVVDAGLPPEDPTANDLLQTADLNLLLLPAVSRMQGCWAWVEAAVQQERRVTTGILGITQADAIRRLHPAAEVIGVPWPHEGGHDAALERWLVAVLPEDGGHRRWGGWPRGLRPHGPARTLIVWGVRLVAGGLVVSLVGRPLLHALPPHVWIQFAHRWGRSLADWLAKGQAALGWRMK